LEKLAPKILRAKKENSNLKIVSVVFQIPEIEAKDIKKTWHDGFKKEVKIYLY